MDGFRCDVAYNVPTDFWEQVRAELVKVKPDLMLLAEASKPELLVKAFDIDYSWPLLATMNSVLIHGAPASDIRRSWEESKAQFPKGALHMRVSDDHDETRAISRYGFNGALAASALMFTLDGVPLLYNGMEAGDATESGDPALHNPEDMLVAALASCHCLSYLALTSRSGIEVVAYEDLATGTMEERLGKGRFTLVVLRPKVTIAAGGDVEKARALHEQAHEDCFIASSVNFPVRNEPSILLLA